MYPMFVTALFTIARKKKPPKCPVNDEWMNKVWYTVEYYLALKKICHTLQ